MARRNAVEIWCEVYDLLSSVRMLKAEFNALTAKTRSDINELLPPTSMNSSAFVELERALATWVHTNGNKLGMA